MNLSDIHFHLVDDNDIDTSVNMKLLQLANISSHVSTYSSAVKFLSTFNENPSIFTQGPNIVLLDIMMPVMDGYTFRTKQLENPEWAKIPTIVMSAEANAKEKMKDYKITAFLSKPVELDTILNAVAKYS